MTSGNPNYIVDGDIDDMLADLDNDYVEMEQKLFNERSIVALYNERMDAWLNKNKFDVLQHPGVKAMVLVKFGYGYWGANKATRTSDGGIRFKLHRVNPDKSRTIIDFNATIHLNLLVGGDTTNARDENVLTASKLARIAVRLCYNRRHTDDSTASPLRTRAIPWATKEDYQYLQIHGALIPLKLRGTDQELAPDQVIACLAINFYNGFSKAKADIKDGLAKKFVQIANNLHVSGSDLVKYGLENQGTAASNTDLIRAWLYNDTTTADYAELKTKTVPVKATATVAAAAVAPALTAADIRAIFREEKGKEKP
jgi:hypothetical protein